MDLAEMIIDRLSQKLLQDKGFDLRDCPTYRGELEVEVRDIISDNIGEKIHDYVEDDESARDLLSDLVPEVYDYDILDEMVLLITKQMRKV